jgi:hypothetical protein
VVLPHIILRKLKSISWLISVGFWRWCISIKRIVFLDFIHRLVSQEQTELRKLKIIDKRSQYTRPQNSHKDQLLTTEPLTWVHTHIKPWSQSHKGGNKWHSHCTNHNTQKPREHKNCIQTKAHAHPHTPLNTRSQKKPRWLISDTATHRQQHAKGGGGQNTNINYLSVLQTPDNG